jgi:putative endonuclease
MSMGHRVGRRGERLAERYLSSLGWKILARNWRAGHTEIDLVARRSEVLAFVEVKTRSQGGAGHPFEAITAKKRTDVGRAAGRWLREHETDLKGIETLRFDAISVELVPERAPQIRHLPDAWRMGE